MINKTELERYMKPQIHDIIKQWDSEGIIYETQFEFSRIYNHLGRIKDILYNILVENGGHKTELHLVQQIEVESEGWMFYFYDSLMYQTTDVKDKVKRYFETHKTTT